MVSIIGKEDLKQKIEQKSAIVVEALDQDAFEKAHIPGAINIPVEKVKDKATSMLPDKNAEIIVYCGGPT